MRFGINLPIALHQNGDSGALAGAALAAPTSSFAAGDLRLAGDLRIAVLYGGPATLGVGVQPTSLARAIPIQRGTATPRPSWSPVRSRSSTR